MSTPRCDSHIHVVGDAARYPQVRERKFLAGVADLAALQKLAAPYGISRFVVVQPSFYGTDNSLLLESLDALGQHGRGVAVVDPAAISREELADYARRGVRGLRINIYSQLGEPQALDQTFAAMARLASDMNWHVEVIASIGDLTHNAEMLAKSPAPVVIDHYGVYGRSTPASAEARRLLDLISLPHVWMKLSAPYRVSANPIETKPNAAWLAAILERAKDRCVWGSDWPHTPAHETQKGGDILLPYRDLSYAALVDDFLAALGSAELAGRIMGENPARLYGFPGSG